MPQRIVTNKTGGLIKAVGSALATLAVVGFAYSANASGADADLIVINADVKTSDKTQPAAEAFAVRDGRFQAIGSSQEIQKFVGDNTTVIDAKGASVVPGFIDGHTHLLTGMTLATGVNLTDIVSKQEWLELIAQKVKALKPGEWLLGGGWNHALSDGVLPTRQMLDKVSPNNPVALYDIDHHTYWVNSLALKEAGITADTPVPDGAMIMLDSVTGESTGILKEGAGHQMQEVPGYMAANDPVKAIPVVVRLANSYGITGVHDMSMSKDVFVDLAEQRKLSLRVWAGKFASNDPNDMVKYAEERDAVYARLVKAGDKGRGPLFTHGYVKLGVDGVLSTYTALMKEPYSDNPSAGPVPTRGEDLLPKLVKAAHAQKFPVAIHAVGDKGVNIALNSFEKSGHSAGMLLDRIEHIEVATPDDAARFKSLHVAASMQPIHATCCVGDYVISRIGQERIPNAYAWRRMLSLGAHLSLSSDWPTAPLNPFKHIAAAMTRTTSVDGKMKPWDKDQTLSFDEALYAYTQATADLSIWGEQIGSITAGKWADFVLLQSKINPTDPENVATAKVQATYLAGDPVYQSKDAN